MNPLTIAAHGEASDFHPITAFALGFGLCALFVLILV